MHARITIDVEIEDPAALHAAAGSDYCMRNAGRSEAFDEAVEFMGPEDAPKLSECLRQLYDVELPGNSGIKVIDSHATIANDGARALRSIPCVTAGTEMLTPAELARINEAFCYESIGPMGHEKRANIDINHDGLYISPKDYGFYLRIPTQEALPEVLPNLTPEMRAIVETAVSQGAIRVEFDCDEDTPEGFEAFDHE